MRKKSGITLIEVTVALIVLGMVTAGMLRSLVMSRRNVNLASRRISALNFAQEKLEYLKGCVGEQGTPNRADLIGPVPDNVNLDPAVNAARSYTINDIDFDADGVDDVKKVTVRINWTEP